jgi:EAL domain-containing protein (putative c-di-GMP-specific phosphodiesterase class I)
MDKQEFELHFQPIVELADPTRISCYETLLRWRHPERGMVPPAEFIPVAEEIGFIVPLGAWILTEACRQAARWNSDARVAVNVSSIQFRKDDVVQRVQDALRISGLPAHRLEVELTESVLMEEGDRMKAILDDLRSLGVRLSMDDFGTGYSSLEYLQKFPFNKIKIDRSFVKEMMHNPRSQSIVKAVAFLGHDFGMTVTAEGVEDEEQGHLLLQLGCHEGQGFHYSRPKPASEFPELWRIDVEVAA